MWSLALSFRLHVVFFSGTVNDGVCTIVPEENCPRIIAHRATTPWMIAPQIIAPGQLCPRIIAPRIIASEENRSPNNCPLDDCPRIITPGQLPQR